MAIVSFGKSLATAAAIALAVHFSTYSLARHLPREIRTPDGAVTRSYNLEAAPLVRLDNLDGAVSVSTHKAANVLLNAQVTAYTDSSKARERARVYAESLPLVERTADEILIVGEPAERPDRVDVVIDYTLIVPENTNLDIKVSRGNVVVGTGCGVVQVAGNNSDIDVTGPQGPVRVMTTNGRIRIADAAGDATLRTVNGNVDAQVRQGRVQATTTVGRITASVAKPSLESLNLTAKNGDITLVLPEGLSADLHALASRGRVLSDYAPPAEAGAPPGREFRGMIGGGKAPITLTAENGDIRIQRSSTP